MPLIPRRSLPPASRSAAPEPAFTQMAALCWRKAREPGASSGAPGEGPGEGPGGSAEDAGRREVLLVSSSSGRWILPKGWPMAGRSGGQAALQEAWEEAGVLRGKVERRPLGEYMALKRTRGGDDVPCRHRVFAVKVRETADDFPEAHRRDRLWVAPERAAELVSEDGLREILRAFAAEGPRPSPA